VLLFGTAASGGLAAPAPRSSAAKHNAAIFPALVCQGGQQCLEIHADQLLGPARAVAEGFTYGVGTTDNSTMIPALHPRSWLAQPGTSAFTEARSNGALITTVVSDAWFDSTYSAQQGTGLAPWDHLATYSAWVRNYVATVVASGQAPYYWEIQNEPDGYFGKKLRATPAQALAEFKVGVAAIRSVLPAAKIVGPGISAFNDRPSSTLDLRTFLDFVAAQHIHLDAVSWHEVGARANPIYSTPDPQSVVTDVARVRGLLAARPSIGHPSIVINEYGSAAEHAIPGQTVGWITALEQANVDQADRACWHSPNVYGQNYSECAQGSLDGLLLGGTGFLPEAVYSVHSAYAAMTGQRVATSSTDPFISAFATRDDSAGAVKVLVGSHATCTPAVRVDCHQQSPTPPPAAVVLQLDVPWTATPATLEIDRIPNQTGVLLAATPVSVQLVTVGPGPIQVPIDGFADGEAYVVTLKTL
jgi:hypothetical protein